MFSTYATWWIRRFHPRYRRPGPHHLHPGAHDRTINKLIRNCAASWWSRRNPTKEIAVRMYIPVRG
jgi:hypothetical protein